MNSKHMKTHDEIILDEVKFILEKRKRTCINCENFDHDQEKCRLVDQRPPLKVIVYGCEQYIEEIPF